MDAENFWSKVDRGKPDECWEWQACLNNPDGYGQYRAHDYTTKLAHRIAWRLEEGDPNDSLVLHKCDNKQCVNPSHLYLGDRSDNRMDEVRRGDRGKLEPEQVREIRQQYETGGMTQQKLATKYGVAQSNISRIINNKRYQI